MTDNRQAGRPTGWPSTRTSTPTPGASPAGARGPDELLRDAVAIRALLEDLEAHEHDVRSRLIAARDTLRLEAARQWRARGWRPIADSR